MSYKFKISVAKTVFQEVEVVAKDLDAAINLICDKGLGTVVSEGKPVRLYNCRLETKERS